jgi:long-chain fatty acid transport protein
VGKEGRRLGATLAVVAALGANTAQADWAQTMGIGQKSTNLGGAVTATSDDYDAFYTNPAGAANFDRPFIGFGIKTFDTRGISVEQTDVSAGWAAAHPDADGLDISPEKTLPGQSIGIVPSGGAYMPVPGMESLVIGIGNGVPFLVSGNAGNDDAPGNYGKFDTTDASLIIVELAPTAALKINDELNVGASIGVTTFKYFKVANSIGLTINDFGLTTPVTIGRVELETDGDVGLPVGPWEFAASPRSVSLTLGAQYKILPNLTLGATYRSETPETFEGEANGVFNFEEIGLPGDIPVQDRFRYEVELPRHLQVGMAWDATSQWKVMADVRWTNWSDAKGFGSPTVIKFLGDNITPAPGPDGIPGVKTITADYNAEDTYSIHLGTAYKLTPNLELQAGYVYDPSFMPEASVDLITFSSNRHIFSLGGTYTKPTEGGEWAFTLGGQLALYEDRHIAAGESGTAGGITVDLADMIGNGGNLKFERNSQGGFDFGGYVWSVGASMSYKFGSGHAALDPIDAPLK